MELLTVIVLRSIERLIGVLIGGFLTWLGYRLFLDISTQADSTGKFSLPGGTAIHITRVGPGIFFSLFGTGIVLISFLLPVEYQGPSISVRSPAVERLDHQTIPDQHQTPEIVHQTNGSYSGAAGPTAPTTEKSKQELRNLRRAEIAVLNRLPQRLKTDLDPSERANFTVAIPKIKLAIMETLWADDWGDFTRFTQWVNSTDTPPDDLKTAVAYFNWTGGHQ
jgi:hypothetical protein